METNKENNSGTEELFAKLKAQPELMSLEEITILIRKPPVTPKANSFNKYILFVLLGILAIILQPIGMPENALLKETRQALLDDQEPLAEEVIIIPQVKELRSKKTLKKNAVKIPEHSAGADLIKNKADSAIVKEKKEEKTIIIPSQAKHFFHDYQATIYSFFEPADLEKIRKMLAGHRIELIIYEYRPGKDNYLNADLNLEGELYKHIEVSHYSSIYIKWFENIEKKPAIQNVVVNPALRR